MVSETQAPTLEQLRERVAEAAQAVTDAEAKLVDVRSDPDVGPDQLLAVAGEVQAARTAHDRAVKAVASAEFEAKAGEREAAVNDFREVLQQKGVSAALEKATNAGITGLTITFKEDGTVEVSSTTPTPAKGKRGGGGRRGSYTWHYNGSDYSSRELIMSFHENADEVIAKAEKGAGFDQPVKRLAAKLGATYTKSDGTSGNAADLI